MRVDLYLDVKENDPLWNSAMLDCRDGGGLWATNRPQSKAPEDVRLKITVQLPDKYFRQPFDECVQVC